MKLEKLIRGVNRSLNLCKDIRMPPDLQAKQIIKGILNSKQAEDIFGQWFGCSPYTYTRRLQPDCSINHTPFGCYISYLRFFTHNLDIDKVSEAKIERLNDTLATINYDSMRSDNIIDLSDIEQFKF